MEVPCKFLFSYFHNIFVFHGQLSSIQDQASIQFNPMCLGKSLQLYTTINLLNPSVEKRHILPIKYDGTEWYTLGP